MRTAAILILVCASARAGDYVVLDGGFPRASARLAKHRAATVLDLDPGNPEALRAALQRLAPRYVAVVLPPGAIDFNFQRRFLQMATGLDDDPFADFAFGYITGRDEDEALAFVDAGIAAAGATRTPGLARLSGGAKRSGERRYAHELRGGSFPVHHFRVAGRDAFPRAGHDRTFAQRALRSTTGVPAVMFVGHGLPAEIIGGPDARDLAAAELDGAVVLNVACYTGVTRGYFERDVRAGRTVRKLVSRDDSFCLAVLRAGACAYTAYLCPRPAGPELYCDLLDAMIRGDTLGTVRRRDYDKTVLGFLGYGAPMRIAPLRDGAPVTRSRDAVRDRMLEGATGGVLFGDPALRPFVPRPASHPIQVEVQRGDGAIRVTATCLGSSLFLLCNDPTLKWDGRMAQKVYARIPLRANEPIAAVELEAVRIRERERRGRLLWAIEEDRGQRFLHMKVNWPRGRGGDLEATVVVRTRAGGADAAPWGRDEVAVAAAAVEIAPALRAVAGRRDVSEAALRAAVVASDALAGIGPATAKDARRELEAFGSEGFRAVCCLLECGRQNARTVELLRDTHRPGDEALLLALAEMDLPRHGTWSVLKGLGIADTPAVRRYLLARLAKERNPGHFMSAARGLARLEEGKAVRPVGEQLLRFDPEWTGVAAALIDVLGELGGRRAARYLEAYCRDERATRPGRAETRLRALDPKAADRVAGRRSDRGQR